MRFDAATRDHLSTLSARARTFGGIVRPICLAVFRLMMKSRTLSVALREIGGFRTFEDLVDVSSSAAKQISIVARITH